MSRVSDYFKYYKCSDATALVTDIVAGKIAYIAGGRAVGQGIAPSGSLTAFYATFDADVDAEDISAWKTAYGRSGLILGAYYPGPAPATGGIFAMDIAADLYAATNDSFAN